jgi:hypothetical protein
LVGACGPALSELVGSSENHTVRELYIFLKPDTNWVGFLETVVYVPSLCTAWFRKPIIHSERICTNWILSVFKFNDYVHNFVIF